MKTISHIQLRGGAKKMKSLTVLLITSLILSLFAAPDSSAQEQPSCAKTNFQIVVPAKHAIKAARDNRSKTLKMLSEKQKISAVSRNNNWYTVCISGKTGYTEAAGTSEVFSSKQLELFSKIGRNKEVHQILAVTGSKAASVKVNMEAYEKVYGSWRRSLKVMKGVIGYNGFAGSKKEGDGKTPMGTFSFGTAFGSSAKPAGVTWPYKKTGAYDYWIDDTSSRDYNKWIHYKGNPQKRWHSFERMNHPLYKYGISINYNTNPIIKGKGSAVFLHVWRGENSRTAGCTATAEYNVRSILNWLDPKQNPRIFLGTTDYLGEL
ncbi:L,D-transpeptidase [Actinomycetes bacterium NPDC127524]